MRSIHKLLKEQKLSKKNSLEAKALRREKKLRPRNYPNFWDLFPASKTKEAHISKPNSVKLRKRSNSASTYHGTAGVPEVIYG